MSHDQSTTSPYRKVSTGTWADQKVRDGLSPLLPSGQALFIMLMIGPQTTNIPGVQPVGRLGFSEMLDWEPEAFDEAFAEVLEQGLAKADWKARLVFVPKAIQHNLPQSPNVVKSWGSTWARVPDCELKREAWNTIYEALSALGDSFAQAFKQTCPLGEFVEINAFDKTTVKPSGKPFEKTLAKTTDNQEQEQEQDIKEAIASSSGSAKRTIPDCPADKLIDAYESSLPMLPTVRRSLFKQGKNMHAMRQRWAWVMTEKHESGERAGQPMATSVQEGVEWFQRYFDYASESDFLTGKNGKWSGCDLAWLLTSSKFENVISGKYHESTEEVPA